MIVPIFLPSVLLVDDLLVMVIHHDDLQKVIHILDAVIFLQFLEGGEPLADDEPDTRRDVRVIYELSPVPAAKALEVDGLAASKKPKWRSIHSLRSS